MIYITKNDLIIYDSSSMTNEEKAAAWAIGSLPEPESRDGYDFIIKVDFDAKEIWYEYEKTPKTTEEQMQELMLAIAELGMQKEADKVETQMALAELASMIAGGDQ